ncbi:MAG: DUF3275 family protein [Cellvibrionaceae bacterium]|nr:DUF3275 family protein [Cellvibrionaceae bacterium]
MPVWVSGNLSVQRIHGVNGEFSVGKLDCEIGVLNIKDPYLDQFETGVYAGRFALSKVFSHGYAARTGCFIVETRALIDECIIYSDEPDSVDVNIALEEVDPLVSDPPPAPAAPQLPRAPAKQKQSAVPAPSGTGIPTASDLFGQSAAVAQADPMEELFGELWPLGGIVKLDPTTIRSDPVGHRARVRYLTDHGYVFRASTQSYHRD